VKPVGHYYSAPDATYNIMSGIVLKRKVNFKREVLDEEGLPLDG